MTLAKKDIKSSHMNQKTTQASWSIIRHVIKRMLQILSVGLLGFVGYCTYEVDKFINPSCSMWVDEKKLSKEEKIRYALELVNSDKFSTICYW